MIVKINRQNCIKKFPNFPQRKYNSKLEDYDSFYPKTISAYVLTLSTKSFKGHITLLGRELTNFTTLFGYKELIFLGDLETPWLYRIHEYKPAREAQQYLIQKKVGKKFNGGFQVDTVEMPIFIQQLTWLIRSNAVLPYVHFMDPGQNIVGSICQYGNLHIYATNKKADRHFREAIAKTKFEYLIDGNCHEKFSKSGKIKGRKIQL